MPNNQAQQAHQQALHLVGTNEIDEKLKSFNIHQLRLLAKNKSISTSINKDPMIEKIKSVYRFRNVHEIVDTLNLLSANQRPYQYALLDPETNPLMIELRKINEKIETMMQRINAMEKNQRDTDAKIRDIRNTLRQICVPVQMMQTNQQQQLAHDNDNYDS